MRTLLMQLCAIFFLSSLVAFGNTDFRSKKTAEKSGLDIHSANIEKNGNARFTLVKELRITVPNTFNHNAQLVNFENENRDSTSKITTETFSDKILTSSAYELTPGKTYTVRIFSFSTAVSYDDCREFMIRNNVKCTGALGLSLLGQLKTDVFPKEKITLSFGDADVVLTQKDTDEVLLLPFVAALKDKKAGTTWVFTVLKISHKFTKDFCLLCFYED